MKSISYFQYTLQTRDQKSLNAVTSSQARSGALLKVEFSNNIFGYSDLFPWPEFGDSELDQQIEFLKRGKQTVLIERSLQMAEIDSQLRAAGQRAFEGANLKNHYLVRDLSQIDFADLRNKSFTSLKIKLDTEFEKQIPDLICLFESCEMKVRLDFNSSLNWLQFETFAKSIPFDHRQRIEFIEDPMPWNAVLWKKAAQFFPLAVDFETNKVPWESLAEVPMRYLILKPARLEPKQVIDRALEFDCKVVVTNSFDHSIGVAHAAKVALDLQNKYPQISSDSGLISNVHDYDSYSQQIITEGAFFRGVPGSGIGFDKLLESTPWLKITS